MNHTKAAWQRQKYAFVLIITLGCLWLINGNNHSVGIELRIEMPKSE